MVIFWDTYKVISTRQGKVIWILPTKWQAIEKAKQQFGKFGDMRFDYYVTDTKGNVIFDTSNEKDIV